MYLISHRGNLDGPNFKDENKPEYILEALSKGYNVEIDVRIYKDKFYLGHDEPQYKIEKNFLNNNKLWCHAKDILALEKLKKLNAICFWHENDDYTLTSNGFIWAYPGKKLIKNSICVLPERGYYKKFNCAGICSDFIQKYK
tara:strand:- start:6970 stop:7395 length:426 start_codon:yes stop_codon:yes gene_type:complete